LNHPYDGAAREILAAASDRKALFEVAVGPEIDEACRRIDLALMAITTFNSNAPRMAEPQRSQCIRMTLLFGKALSDTLGAIELLTRGYEELCLGVMRSAVESWATAVLIGCDPEVGRQFVEGRFSTNSSIKRLLRHKAVAQDPEWKRQIEETYKSLHSFAHPTVMGLVPLRGDGGMFLGGRFQQGRIEDYRGILTGCAQMARNIEVFVPKSRPSSEVARTGKPL
jgi:hypothetical protein